MHRQVGYRIGARAAIGALVWGAMLFAAASIRPGAAEAAAPLAGVDGRAEVLAVAMRADADACVRGDLDVLDAIEREAPATPEVRGDLALVRAFALDCLGRRDAANESADVAAASLPLWRGVAWRFRRELPPDAADIPLWHLGPGGLNAWRRRAAAEIPETRAALTADWDRYAPTDALSADLEALQWAMEPDRERRVQRRLVWLARGEVERVAAARVRELAVDPVGMEWLRSHGAARDVALEVAAAAAWRGRADVANSVSDTLVAIDALPVAEERGLRLVWAEVARLDGRRADAARRELQHLAGGGGRAGAEAAWALVVDARRADRDAEALARTTQLIDAALGARRADALEACVHLAGGARELDRQRRCWRQHHEVARYAPRELREALAIEVAVDALAARDAVAADAVLDLALQRGHSAALVYWRARVYEALERYADAVQGYEDAGQLAPLGYYGWSADARLERLERPPKFEARLRTLIATPPDPTLVDVAPAARLLALGMPNTARRWGAWGAQLAGVAEPASVVAASRAHVAVGEPRIAMWLLQRHAPLGDWSSASLAVADEAVVRWAWPMPFDKPFGEAALQTHVSAAVLRAFARRESSFDPDAVSSVGARGLLQVMLDTAREVTGRAGWTGRVSRRDLLDPWRNTLIGALALAEWFEDPGPCIEPVAVGYAAGPGKVRRWIAAGQPIASDAWLERMPYPTVRVYARDITVARAAYAVLRGERVPATDVCVVRAVRD